MGSRLPSAKISGHQLPTTVFDFAEAGCDAIDLGVVSEQQPKMFDFLKHSDLDPLTIASVQQECDLDKAIDCDISVTSDDDSLPPPVLLPTGTGTYDSTLNGDGFFNAMTPTGDSPIAALYKMSELVCTGCSRVDVYKEVCQVGGKVYYGSDDDPDGQLCGHMDGGSMVNTCHCSALFWGEIHPFKESKRPILQVADKFEHHAQGWGYIRVPSDTTYGYTEVCCLYTPTLVAVILSPNYSGKFLHCRGYVSVSNFDGQGCGLRCVTASGAHKTSTSHLHKFVDCCSLGHSFSRRLTHFPFIISFTSNASSWMMIQHRLTIPVHRARAPTLQMTITTALIMCVCHVVLPCHHPP